MPVRKRRGTVRRSDALLVDEWSAMAHWSEYTPAKRQAIVAANLNTWVESAAAAEPGTRGPVWNLEVAPTYGGPRVLRRVYPRAGGPFEVRESWPAFLNRNGLLTAAERRLWDAGRFPAETFAFDPRILDDPETRVEVADQAE